MSILSTNRIYNEAIHSAEASSKCRLGSLWKGWVVARLQFADSAINGVVSAVHDVFNLVYNTALALTFGLAFTNPYLRARVRQSGSDLADDLSIILKSVVGVVWPYLAKSIEEGLASRREDARPKNTPVPLPVTS